MKNFFFSAFIFIILSMPSLAWDSGPGTFLPDNDLSIPVDPFTSSGLTESQFHSVIDKVELIYDPLISSKGEKLRIHRNWNSTVVNAKADRNQFWNVYMYGGLARHPKVTEDGFSLILCHEIGHHIGGAPKASMMNAPTRWASNEGQSDYFAVLKCLRKVFLSDNNEEVIKKISPPKSLVKKCTNAWKSSEESSLCIRIAMAGYSAAELFSSIRNVPAPSFETRDPSVVKVTQNNHPAPQCRLDTYLQGALCEASFLEELSSKDEVQGTCHPLLGHTTGLRPSCWYRYEGP